MKYSPVLSAALLALSLASLAAQPMAPVPEREKTPDELAVRLDSAAPLASLESQLASASFDQRGDLAAAFDVVNRSVDERVAALRAEGLVFSPEASDNLESAREYGRQAFRDLSLTTEETWRTGRYVGLVALRKIQNSLAALQRTATPSQ